VIVEAVVEEDLADDLPRFGEGLLGLEDGRVSRGGEAHELLRRLLSRLWLRLRLFLKFVHTRCFS
jgi:hypothetical protein